MSLKLELASIELTQSARGELPPRITRISYPDFSGHPEGLRSSSIMHRNGSKRNNRLAKFPESLNSPLCSDDEFEST